MKTRSKSRKFDANQNQLQKQILPQPHHTHKNLNILQNQVFDEFKMFSDENDIDIEGLKYSQIENSQTKKNYLQRLRSNLPEYALMSSHKKAFYFKKLTLQYTNQINQNNQQLKNKTSKKQVSFSNCETFVVFDKFTKPGHIRNLQQGTGKTKF